MSEVLAQLEKKGGGNSLQNAACFGNNSASGSFVLDTATYGSDFIVVVDISAYQSRYTIDVTGSGVTYEYIKPMSAVVTNYNVTSHVCVLKCTGSGSITISYTSTDGNIHACQITVVY